MLIVRFFNILPFKSSVKKKFTHRFIWFFSKTVVYWNMHVKKILVNFSKETFSEPTLAISNHQSVLDLVFLLMLHPKIVIFANDGALNHRFYGSVIRFADFIPSSAGLDEATSKLRDRMKEGYSVIIFPEGTRSADCKIKRFHKGAFYLAEKFNMDIVPVLIHGNSEVLPKGSFVIKDGSITVKILDRISTEDLGYGKNYRERNKGIAAYFRSQFQNLRNEVEGDTYFTRTILEDYRYKGDSVYRTVKKDLRNNSKIYTLISKRIETSDSIIHLSKEYGQLDFLLSLNAVDRKIYAYLADEEIRPIVKNSFIAQQIAKLTLTASIEEAMEQPADIMIIDLEIQDLDSLAPKIKNNIRLLILVKDGAKLLERIILSTGFKNVFENENLIILEKNMGLE